MDPRSVEYLIWRFRERMHVSDETWNSFSYEEQLRALAYERLRQSEERMKVQL